MDKLKLKEINIALIFQMVRHGGCLGLGLAAMGTARQGKFSSNDNI